MDRTTDALRERLDALTPEQRAELLTRLRAQGTRHEEDEAIRPVPPEEPLPLSHAQLRLWFLDQLMEHRPVYHTPVVLRLRGPLSPAALERALTTLVGRHAVLRSRFLQAAGRHRQIVDPPPAAVPLPLEDLSELDAAEREQLTTEYITWAARESFDLAEAPPLRARLLRFADDDHVFALLLHHIVLDDWSVPLLVNEVAQCYLATLAGTEPALPDLAVQYADYAVWQQHRLAGPVGDRLSAYWSRQLAGLSAARLPTDRPRPHRPTWAGETVTVRLPARLSQAHRGLLLTMLATALNALLARWTDETDIAVGTVFSGRIRPELEPLIGFFANTVVLRTDTSGDPSLRTLLERTTETVMNAHTHQELPFDQVVTEQRPARSGARNPLFQVALVTSDAPVEGFALGELTLKPYDVQLGTSRFDLTLGAVRLADGGVALNAEYSTELFDRDRIDHLLHDFRTVLEALASAPDTRLSELALAPPEPGVLPAEEAEEDPPEVPVATAQDSWSPVGQVVAEVWCETLCVAEAGPDADFFGLGGGSLQAISLIMEIREQLGVSLDVGDFFAMPTLGAVVGRVESALLEEAPDFDFSATEQPDPVDRPERPELVVPLRAGQDAPPLFLIHASGGSSMAYAALCRELPAGIPCCGIEALGLDGGELPDSFESMAHAYADAIRIAQPHGPYRLIGWSVGGGLAYATAVRLREQGEQVRLVAMLDTQQPPILSAPPDAAVLRTFFAENFALTAGLPSLGPSASDLAGLDDAEQTEKVIRTLIDSGLVPPESAQLVRQRMAVFIAIVSAAAVYRPDQYDDRIDLFLTEASPESTAEGWSRWNSGPVIVHAAPGDHYGMMRAPHVAALGRTLGELVERSFHSPLGD